MMRSMFAAISGLKNHQTMMDVVGNNIANVNTTGFKQSRVTFQDILSQTVKGASGPQGGRGGVNPQQIGLGVLISGIDTIQTQGTLQSTGKLTDMAIQGDGYFVMSDGNQDFFTRDGSFDLGIDGTLVNPASGLHVMGWLREPVDDIEVARGLAAGRVYTYPLGEYRLTRQLPPALLIGFAGTAEEHMPRAVGRMAAAWDRWELTAADS